MKPDKSNPSTARDIKIEAKEWDLSDGMGILPDDVSFTQNIGCVGGKSEKPANSVKKPTQ